MPRRRTLSVLALLLTLPALVGARRAGAPSFAYDRGLPFAIRPISQWRQDGVVIRQLSFAVDRSTRTSAYLVVPRSRARSRAAVLFDPGRFQSRSFFLSEAIATARRGAVCLSIDDLSRGYPSFGSHDRAVLVERVVTLRRALDLLSAQPRVDPRRLGFVGHSDGAELGGILAGVDRRAHAYVLMSGGGVWDRSRDDAYDHLIAPLDPDNYIGRAAPATLFFQSGLDDAIVPRADALRYQRLASRPKRVRWYPAGHMLDAQAERDRQAWLGSELRLGASR